MKKIGITGGIGSGKSTVAGVFRGLGVPVFSSDDVARNLQNENDTVRKNIQKIFGKDIYVDGKLNRAKLASVVFTDKNKLEKLNSIVHPAVWDAFQEFLEENKSAKYILKEAAILYEIGDHKELDGMIVVTAPEKVRIQRVMMRDGISEEAVLARLKNQWTEEEKVKRADFLISNNGKEMLLHQVLVVHEKLLLE